MQGVEAVCLDDDEGRGVSSVTPLDCYLMDCRTVPVYDKVWDYQIAKIR